MITVHYSVVHYTLYTVVCTHIEVKFNITTNIRYKGSQINRQILEFSLASLKKILCNLNYPRAEQKKLSFDGITMQEY